MTNILHQISTYFGLAIAFLVVIQPFAIPLTTLAHSVEVLAKKRGWARAQTVAYWVAKVAGTFAIVDLRNVARAVFSVITQILALLPATKAQQAHAVKDAARTLVLLVGLGAALHSTGCAGTLEETRGSVKMRSLLGVQVAPVDRAECQRLSRLESISTILASGLAFAAGASGVATVPVRSANGKTALAITALSLGALSASSVAAETRFRAEWQQAGCDQ